jgi:mRNA interferase MazF
MFKRGGIYQVSLGHEGVPLSSDICPCLVVSNNISNEFSPVVTVIPLGFTNLDRVYDFETLLPAAKTGLERDAKVSSHLLITIDKTMVVSERLGFVGKMLMSKVGKALRFQLDL